MKYKLLKPLPGIEVGTICEYHKDDTEWVSLIEWSTIAWLLDFIQWFWLNNDFFEPIVEKKTYDDLKRKDRCFEINYNWNVYESYFIADSINCRSETFLTRQEAEDEHARRELAVRKDRFIPNENECYFYPSIEWEVEFSHNDWYSTDYMMINAGLVFATRQECQDAIDNHDIVRLFYTIR